MNFPGAKIRKVCRGSFYLERQIHPLVKFHVIFQKVKLHKVGTKVQGAGIAPRSNPGSTAVGICLTISDSVTTHQSFDANFITFQWFFFSMETLKTLS